MAVLLEELVEMAVEEQVVQVILEQEELVQQILEEVEEELLMELVLVEKGLLY